MNYYNYFTEVEEHFVRRRGKHLLLSPMDWSLIATWRDSGVPLHVALRGVDIAMDGFFAKPHRASAKVNSLFYCHDSVMAEYAGYLDAHVGESRAPATGDPARPGPNSEPRPDQGPDRSAILKFLEARMSEIKVLRAKLPPGEGVSEGLDRVLHRLEEIARELESEKQTDFEALERDLGILDELLISELSATITPEQMATWEQEAKTELKVYRKRLPKDTYQKILDNFLRGRIHRHFDVGELSLFHL